MQEPTFERTKTILMGLRGTSSASEKLAALGCVVDYWHGPIETSDGIPAADLADIAMPDPLRWWYR